MDPASFALSVVAAFKDAYLVAKFIYNTINSGIKHAEERVGITWRLRHEVLFLQSFGSWLVESKGWVTNNSSLNAAWLQDIRVILEALKFDLAEYRNVAEKTDEDYRKFSPVLVSAYQDSGLIEFELGQELPPLAEPSFFGNLFSKKTLKEVYTAGEWALFGKRKLEKLVTRFEKRNKQLYPILQLAVTTQIQVADRTSRLSEKWLKTHHPDRLGLRGHVQISKVQQTRNQDSENLQIGTSKLICDTTSFDDGSALIQGRLKIEKAKNNFQEESVLVEFKQYTTSGAGNEADKPQREADKQIMSRHFDQVTKLAARLRSSGLHKLGTLPFKGFLDQPEQNRYTFLFKYPEGSDRSMKPKTLHSLLDPDADREASGPWPLGQRFHGAHRLATVLGGFINAGWVHKSIRSHSVAFFYKNSSKDLLITHPYLINFEYSRLHYNTTYLDRDEDPEKDLYRHPDLQVSNRQDSFSCVHDIYALGVVLLEIALWKTVAQIIDEYADDKPQTAKDVRRLYIKIAKLEVPWHMGDAFLEAVLACLSTEYEDDFLTPDRGTFQRKVIENLSSKALHVEE